MVSTGGDRVWWGGQVPLPRGQTGLVEIMPDPLPHLAQLSAVALTDLEVPAHDTSLPLTAASPFPLPLVFEGEPG